MKHQLRDGKCSCRKECTAVISEDRRKRNHCQFWEMAYGDRQNFVFGCMERIDKADSTRDRLKGMGKTRAKKRTYLRTTTPLVSLCTT